MGYYIDLKAISIDQLKEILLTMELIPSWRILEDDIDANFNKIKEYGINNLEELLLALKTKIKVQDFAASTHVPENFLTILNRMVKGYKQKPVKLKDFVWIDDLVIAKLENANIDDTLKLYENPLAKASRKSLAADLGIDQGEISRLAKLADLTRIRWVNHTFAYVLLLAGYDTAQKVAEADFKQMYDRIRQANEEAKIYKAHIGLNDMKMCIDAAKLLDFEMEY